MNRINYFAVLAAAIANWLLGALWYSPLLFADRFIALMEWDQLQLAQMSSQSHVREIAVAFVVSIVTAYVIALLISHTNARTVVDGIKLGVLLSLGLLFTTSLESVLFELRKPGLYFINNGYHLVGFIIMGAILAAWRKKDVAAS
jgi:surface polysaccharide O-acyltransferase-like enzyme